MLRQLLGAVAALGKSYRLVSTLRLQPPRDVDRGVVREAQEPVGAAHDVEGRSRSRRTSVSARSRFGSAVNPQAFKVARTTASGSVQSVHPRQRSPTA